MIETRAALAGGVAGVGAGVGAGGAGGAVLVMGQAWARHLTPSLTCLVVANLATLSFRTRSMGHPLRAVLAISPPIDPSTGVPMTTIAHPAPRNPGPRLAAAPVMRPRVLVLLEQYPQAGQTGIRNEIEALAGDYDIGIIALKPAAQPYAGHRPFAIAATLPEIMAALETFAPDLLHAHHLPMLGMIAEVSRLTGIPFTLRTASRDILALRPRGLRERVHQMLRGEQATGPAPGFAHSLPAIDSELCLGVLGLPFARPWLKRAGLREAKLVDCFPVVSFARFHDRSPNGDAVMTIGAATAGKARGEFLRLACKVPDRSFNLYTTGGSPNGLRGDAARHGANVTFVPPVEPDDMPREYKRHRWLVLTADAAAPQAGWPMAIAEAQAAGVGVCMPALRPDLALYVGEGAGILFDTVDELPAIVSGPVPEEMRERGFEQARKSDIERHRHLLTDLWDDALRTRAAEGRGRAGAAGAVLSPVIPAGVATPA